MRYAQAQAERKNNELKLVIEKNHSINNAGDGRAERNYIVGVGTSKGGNNTSILSKYLNP
jgi:hypothetical protein